LQQRNSRQLAARRRLTALRAQVALDDAHTYSAVEQAQLVRRAAPLAGASGAAC
jgi:hypothetical protein